MISLFPFWLSMIDAVHCAAPGSHTKCFFPLSIHVDVDASKSKNNFIQKIKKANETASNEFVRPKLEPWAIAWNIHPQNNYIDTEKKIQRSAARFALNDHLHTNNVTYVHHKLSWQTLERHWFRQQLTFFYKIKRNVQNIYLPQHLIVPCSLTRNRDPDKLIQIQARINTYEYTLYNPSSHPVQQLWERFIPMSTVYYHEHGLLSRARSIALSTVYCHEHGLLPWTRSIVMSTVYCHEHGLLPWTRSIVMNTVYCHEHGILPWTRFIAMSTVYCHEHGLLPWARYIAMRMLNCHEHGLLPWARYIAMSTVYCHEHGLLPWARSTAMSTVYCFTSPDCRGSIWFFCLPHLFCNILLRWCAPSACTQQTPVLSPEGVMWSRFTWRLIKHIQQ